MKWITVLALVVIISTTSRAQAQYGFAPQSGGLPSLGRAQPDGALNPRYEEVPLQPEMLGSGVALFGIGWLATIITGSIVIATNAGVDNGRSGGTFGYGGDNTCHDTLGAVSMVPLLGPFLGMIVWGSCTVPTYRYDTVRDEYRQNGGSVGITSDGGYWAYFIPTAVSQVLGLALAIPGVLGTHTGLVFDSSGSARAPQLHLAVGAPGADVGISVRIEF